MISSLRKVENKQVIAISFNRNVDPKLLEKVLNQIQKEWSEKEILLVHGTMDRETRKLKEISTETLDVIDQIFPPETQESFYGKTGTKRRTMARFIHNNNATVYFIGRIPHKSGMKIELYWYKLMLGEKFKKQTRFIKK
ncbi:MAG: hypothetical protein ACD_80C00229G0002 [uncultured bacterium (gcode 4)]|uniref:Uncharacterized protein n=1 Tax=uncultured bacterium (gcode 4) TaxID=1234023 RepID=K1XGT7_9BACT|nr:MAG: hypothetical protein ACD_80C00229G0002 [uncultured bacterium (gcode 4)]HBB03577.1 hypothetical protein [Candidatus Gracilibacteria bacterium]